MTKNLRKKTEGFTIIEVLIVLAIAGLVMLIVFLAVPALQRNSRNNARNQDASRISAAVTECLANRNGRVDACDSATEIGDVPMSRLESFGFGGTHSETVAQVHFSNQCTPAGDALAGGGGTRAFAVMYSLERPNKLGSPNIPRCISG